MRRILVVNGPNLNLLGKREPEIYGTSTLEELNSKLETMARELKIELVFFQSNSEGELVDFIQKHGFEADGLVINPGALTHYSYSLRDAVAAVRVEAIEVHLSNIYAREEARHKSVLAPVCRGHLVGFGFYGYAMAISYFADTTKAEQ